MTSKQFRALGAVFIILDALIEDVQEATYVLNVAIRFLEIVNTVPEYKIINSFLDAMEKKYATEKEGKQ